MSIASRFSGLSPAKPTLALSIGALIAGAGVRLVTPSASVLVVFLVLLAAVLACLLIVSLGQADAPAWRRVLVYPLAIFGLCSFGPPASPAGTRSSILVAVLACLAGFILVQMVLW